MKEECRGKTGIDARSASMHLGMLALCLAETRIVTRLRALPCAGHTPGRACQAAGAVKLERKAPARTTQRGAPQATTTRKTPYFLNAMPSATPMTKKPTKLCRTSSSDPMATRTATPAQARAIFALLGNVLTVAPAK